MPTIVVACSMLEDEIRRVMQEEQLHYEIRWLDRGLHEWPKVLYNKVQHAVGELEQDYDEILLCYGLCGNALRELRASRAVLAAMRCHDCIHMLLPGRVDSRSLYFTGGWIRSDKFIGEEYNACLEKYGEDKTKRIYRSILGEYQCLCMVDTGSYELEQYMPKAKEAAGRLGLTFKTTDGQIEILRKLLTHRWDQDIVSAAPGTPLNWDLDMK